MWYNSRFFKYSIGTILVLLIIYLCILLAPVINALLEFITTLLLPLLIGGVLFYILRPLRDLLEKNKIPRLYAIAIIYCALAIVIALITIYLWPFFSEQITSFSQSPAGKIQEVQDKTIDFINIFNFADLSTLELKRALDSFLRKMTNWLTQDIISVIGKFTKITSLIIFTPFILFYFLKDSSSFQPLVFSATPKTYKDIMKRLLRDFDATLHIYIGGQFLIAVIIGTLMFIGYSIIGLPYALLLAMLALVFNMIPFIGTFISTIPALLVGFAESPWLAFKVLLVILVVHLLDANVISPYILGSRLNIHPMTILLLLITCGSLYGILGLLLAAPIYALIKVLVMDLYDESTEKAE